MKQYLLVAISLISFTSCSRLFEPEHFGVKESVWNTLSEECKQKAIEGYNERKRRKLEIDAEFAKRQQEIDANNAPYEFALKVAETITNNGESLSIKKVDSLFQKVTLSNNTSYSIELSSNIKHWKKGDTINIYKNKDSITFDWTLANKRTGETARAYKR